MRVAGIAGMIATAPATRGLLGPPLPPLAGMAWRRSRANGTRATAPPLAIDPRLDPQLLATPSRVGYVPRLQGRGYPAVTVSRAGRSSEPFETMTSQADARELIASHHRRLVGWFCIRVGDRDIAEELAQRAWIEVLRRIHTYTSERASFFTFTLIWADKILRRHRTQVAIERKRFVYRTILGEHEGDDDDPIHPGSDAGESPTEPPTVVIDRPQVFSAMLALTLGCDRMPHEILTFGYIRLLGWKPAAFVAEFRSATLREIATLLYRDYRQDVADGVVDLHFRNFIERLAAPLTSWKCDPRTRKPYAAFLDLEAGGTRLEQYFREDKVAEELVAHWWDAVAGHVGVRMTRLTEGPLAEWIEDFVAAQHRGKP